MPMYDFQCDACMTFGETIIPLADYDPDGLPCPNCGELAKRGVPAVRTVGPMPSKPLFSNADGLVVDSNAKLREYKRQNPGTEVLSADSNDWRNRYDRARNLAEDRAIKRGYRDFQHQNVSRRDKKLERKANEKARRT